MRWLGLLVLLAAGCVSPSPVPDGGDGPTAGDGNESTIGVPMQAPAVNATPVPAPSRPPAPPPTPIWLEGNRTAPFPNATLRARETGAWVFLVNATDSAAVSLSILPLREPARDFSMSAKLIGPGGRGEEEGVLLAPSGGAVTLRYGGANRTDGDPPLVLTVRVTAAVAVAVSGQWYWDKVVGCTRCP